MCHGNICLDSIFLFFSFRVCYCSFHFDTERLQKVFCVVYTHKKKNPTTLIAKRQTSSMNKKKATSYVSYRMSSYCLSSPWSLSITHSSIFRSFTCIWFVRSILLFVNSFFLLSFYRNWLLCWSLFFLISHILI